MSGVNRRNYKQKRKEEKQKEDRRGWEQTLRNLQDNYQWREKK